MRHLAVEFGSLPWGASRDPSTQRHGRARLAATRGRFSYARRVMLTLVTQAALLAIVVSLASAAALVLKDRRPLYVRFAALSLSVAAYYLAVFLDALVPAGGLGRV